MTSMFSSPKTPKLPQQEVVESVQTVKDDATETQKATKRKIAATGGRESTMLSGIQAALKKRLGD